MEQEQFSYCAFININVLGIQYLYMSIWFVCAYIAAFPLIACEQCLMNDINNCWILNVQLAQNDFKKAHCSCEHECVSKDMTIIFVIVAEKIIRLLDN